MYLNIFRNNTYIGDGKAEAKYGPTASRKNASCFDEETSHCFKTRDLNLAWEEEKKEYLNVISRVI